MRKNQSTDFNYFVHHFDRDSLMSPCRKRLNPLVPSPDWYLASKAARLIGSTVNGLPRRPRLVLQEHIIVLQEHQFITHDSLLRRMPTQLLLLVLMAVAKLLLLRLWVMVAAVGDAVVGVKSLVVAEDAGVVW